MDVLKKIWNSALWCFHDIDEDNWFYKMVALVGLVVRVGLLPLLLPEPFEYVSRLLVGQLGLPVWAYEIIIRLLLLVIDSLAFSRIFYLISYRSVGNMYETDSDEPWWGSICYTIFYLIYMAIPIILMQFFYWWVIAFVLGGYLLINLLLYIISVRIDTFPDSWWWRAIIHGVAFAAIGTIVILLKVYVF